MTPLMVSETVCPGQTDYIANHGVTVSLALYDPQTASRQGVPQPVYQLEAAMWAVEPTGAQVRRLTLHTSMAFDLTAITSDYHALAEYYNATHALTIDEIEDRTRGRFR